MNSHQRRVDRRIRLRRFNNTLKLSRSIILPIMKKVVPGLIANEIISVQPMTGPVGQIFTMRTRYTTQYFERVAPDEYGNINVPDGYCVVDVNTPIGEWIQAQPIHHWKDAESLTFLRDRYVISDVLYTAMSLRWS